MSEQQPLDAEQPEAPPVWRVNSNHAGVFLENEGLIYTPDETCDYLNNLERQPKTDQAALEAKQASIITLCDHTVSVETALEEAWKLLDRIREHATHSTWPWPWIADVDALRTKQGRS